MAFTLEFAKKRLGIDEQDTSQDDAIKACLAVALSLAETYCDRGLEFKEDVVEEFERMWQRTLRVYRYPIKEVTSINTIDPVLQSSMQANSDVWLDKKAGIIKGVWCGYDVEVTYSGGYDPLPADLEYGLWLVFDAVWYSTPGMGQAAGSSSEDTAGPIRAFTINGVRMEYSTKTNAFGSSGGSIDPYGIIPENAIAVLDKYRAETALSGA